jgi:hypothetical protein
MTPIFDHRTIVGYAKSEKHAKRIVKGLLQHVPKGWKISVRLRDCSVIDLPHGFIYSVHP